MKITTTFNFNNQSGRIYDRDEISKALNDYVNRHNDDQMLGEIHHGREFDDGAIHLKDVSHKIKTINNDNDIVSIEAELLDTPKGKLVQEMINAGCSISMRPRMYEHTEDVINEDGNVVGQKTVIDNIVSFDIDINR